jgi:hypothetical protein
MPPRRCCPPTRAQPLRLPPGSKRLRLDLAPGTAAILGWRGAEAVTIWSGDTATSRLAEGEWTEVLLVNTTAAAAPASLALATLDASPLALRPGQPLKRFIGAAGSLMLPVHRLGRTSASPWPAPPPASSAPMAASPRVPA